LKQIRKRLTYANVMSSLAVFLVLGGATAFAASHLAKNSVGSRQLKKNAVTAAKIKKGAVTGAKLADGAVTEGKIGNGAVSAAKLADGAVSAAKLGDGAVSGAKIQSGAVTGEKVADGSLSGADINAGSTSFSQIVARLRNAGPMNLQATGSATALGSYTQSAGEDDLYLGGLDVTFSATCVQPRSATLYLLLDPPNPFAPTADSIAGYGVVSDLGPGAVTKRTEFTEIAGTIGMKRLAQGAAQNHTFYVYVVSSSCSSGSGILGSNAGVDVLGTK